MEKLLLMLEALVIGMRGAKRVAMDIMIKDLWEATQDNALDLHDAQEETERTTNHLWDANNRAQKAEMAAKILGEEIESLRIEADASSAYEAKLKGELSLMMAERDAARNLLGESLAVPKQDVPDWFSVDPMGKMGGCEQK